MGNPAVCKRCGGTVPAHLPNCQDCGKFHSYPNVREAEDPEEQHALWKRYQEAIAEAASRSACIKAKGFEQDVLNNSKAVITSSLQRIQELIMGNGQVYATFYQAVKAGTKIPVYDEWNLLRPIADEILFPYYKEHLHFAALSRRKRTP